MIDELNAKKSNVYMVCNFSSKTLFKTKNAYDVSLSKYNSACDDYNVRFNKLDDNIVEANKLNDELAYKETEIFCKEVVNNRKEVNKCAIPLKAGLCPRLSSSLTREKP